MVQIRHCGIYVKDLEKMALFYKQVFHMYPVCENVIQEDHLIDDIFQCNSAKVKITKLITDQGKESGHGDMVELIQPLAPCTGDNPREGVFRRIYLAGTSHIAFGVDHVDLVLERLLQHGGKTETKVHVMDNGNVCCFCQDPEGNYLEIIGRKN